MSAKRTIVLQRELPAAPDVLDRALAHAGLTARVDWMRDVTLREVLNECDDDHAGRRAADRAEIGCG